MLTQAEIERRIIETVDALDELTHEFAEIAAAAGRAEAEWKRKHALMTLAIIENPPEGRKLDAKSRDARIELAAQDEFAAYQIASAAREHAREALRAHRTRLDALRTLSANVRTLTDPRLPG